MLNDELLYGTKIYHKKFSKLCSPLKKYLGLTETIYINIDKNGGLINIHSNYTWMQKYVKQNCYKLDRHMVHPDNIHNGFCFLTISNDYKYQEYNNAMLNKTSEEINFYYGFTYVIKTKSDFSAFCFITNQDNYKIINRLVNETNIIKLFIKKLSKQLEPLFSELQQHKVDLIKLKGDDFFYQKGIVFNE